MSWWDSSQWQPGEWEGKARQHKRWNCAGWRDDGWRQAVVPVARATDEVEPGTASANASGEQSSSAGPHAAPPPPGSAAPAPGIASARLRFLAAIPEEGAREEEDDSPDWSEVADGAPLGTRPDPWEEGTRGIPHQSTRARSWCQCHICQPCPDLYAREWGGPLPPGTAGTGEEPSSSRAGVPGTASASPVHRLGTAIGDRPHDRAMRELGPDQRELWLTGSGW